MRESEYPSALNLTCGLGLRERGLSERSAVAQRAGPWSGMWAGRETGVAIAARCQRDSDTGDAVSEACLLAR